MSEEGDEVIQATPTCVESKKINAIDRDTVHKICSGQVVLNLATAVKELVENAIDAGATLVEVKLRDQGAELIEVSDNGSGVEEKNFQGMTAKYHTSKLKEFADLESIETFGFRGEALSSLCALSDMVILTRHSSAPHGTKLELNHDGAIVKQSPCARSVGTTVSLTNLFATLPVRKKDFQRNIKREFFKMCHILQAYCLVSVGVKIICTNQSKKGAKSVVLGTHGANSVLDNVTALFGPKQTAELMELKPAIGSNGKIMDLVESDFENSFALTQEEVDNFNLSRYKLEGYISSCAHDAGRSAKDRQFFFINARPCDPKQISKLVNDDYHRYNASKYPFVFLNIKLDRTDVDVNVTPDKRQVLVNNEKILMLALKKSIMKTFGSVPSSFKLQNLNVSDSSRLLNISFKSDKEDPDDDDEKEVKYQEMFSQWQAPGGSAQTGSSEVPTTKRKRGAKSNNGLQKVREFFESQTRPTIRQPDSESEDEGDAAKPTKLIRNDGGSPDSSPYNLTILSGQTAPPDLSAKMESNRVIRCGTSSPMDFESIDVKNEPGSSQEPGSPSSVNIKVERMASNVSSCSSDFFSSNPDQEPVRIEIEDEPTEAEKDDYGSRNCRTIPLNMDTLRQSLEDEQKLRHGQRHQQPTNGLSRLKFKSKINPSSNKSAEEELQTEIGKEHFRQMEIIGQFNLGFIVARLEDDLFIIDQHATDEKYNFEDLQRTTVLQNQKLVIAQPLELTAVNEMVLMDNLEIFEMNGFKFELDGAAMPTRKVKLIAKPYSRNWEFGKEDIDELIFMLQDAPNTVCRPSRVRAMFASRACRKSVMIGRALSVKEMKRLVVHMGEIEQPWNCPHGRPTMRHLVNLAMISDIKKEKPDDPTEM